MRRILSCETLHGTRYGSLMIDAQLAADYRLTERECACATLLKVGRGTQEIADRMGIAHSTAEKHLVSLRRKLGVGSTLEAAITLIRLEDENTARSPEGFRPVMPVTDPRAVASDRTASRSGPSSRLVGRLVRSNSLDEMLGVVREESSDDGVAALFYFFLPLSAASFRRQDVLRSHSAPGCLVAAFERDAGQTQGQVAARLFAEPDRAFTLELASPPPGAVSPPVAEACRRAELDHATTVGSPFGAGYVAMTAFFRGSITSEIAREAEEAALRDRLMTMQNLAFSFGALARTADLSRRERDVLSMMASGLSIREAAERDDSSERALGQLLKSVREKLRAETTSEAVAKSMALNALVFL